MRSPGWVSSSLMTQLIAIVDISLILDLQRSVYLIIAEVFIRHTFFEAAHLQSFVTGASK
jgi:hypothetical protein